MDDYDDITPAGVAREFWRWWWVIAGGMVLLGVFVLVMWQAGWWFTVHNTSRNYSNITRSQQYQQSLIAEMQPHVTNISGPDGLAATRASLPATSGEQQVLRAQELNELSQLCSEAVNFYPLSGAAGAAEIATVISANCYAGAPVANPPLAPAAG